MLAKKTLMRQETIQEIFFEILCMRSRRSNIIKYVVGVNSRTMCLEFTCRFFNESHLFAHSPAGKAVKVEQTCPK